MTIKSKKYNLFLIAIIVILVIIIFSLSNAIDSKNQIINNQNELLSKSGQQAINQVKYLQDDNTLAASLQEINITQDYSSCIYYVDQLQNEYNLTLAYNKNSMDYFNFVTNKINTSVCFKKLIDLNSEMSVFQTAWQAYINSYLNWCNGYYKDTNNLNWVESYNTPFKNSLNTYNQEYKKFQDDENSLILTCNQNLV